MASQNKVSALVLVTLAIILLPVVQASPRPFQGNVSSVSSSPEPSQHSLAGPVGPNIDIAGEAFPDRQQVETTVAGDPHNSSILVAGAQDLRLKPLEHRWHGYYRSTDNGLTWTSSLLPGYPGDTSPQGLSSPLHESNTTSDPVVAFDRLGNLYYAGLIFNSTGASGQSATAPRAFVAKYANDGATYLGTTLIPGSYYYADKEWIAVDNSGGPHDGTVYLAFDANLTFTSNFGTLFTRSTDGGLTFSSPFYVPADMTGNFPGITVDAAGYVYVSTDAFDPLTGAFLYYIQVTTLAPGGASIIRSVRVVDPADWITTTVQGGQFRAFTIPQMASDSNGVYLVFDDLREGNASVFLTRSVDGGASWTAPLRINDVTAGQHFFPTIATAGGVISVAWYDSRLSPSAGVGLIDVYFSESLDGGASFLPNIRVTTSSFNPNTARRTDGGNYLDPFMGDYIGIAATPSAAHPVWADNLNVCDTIDANFGCVDQDAFTSTIGLADFSIAASPLWETVQEGTTGSSKISLTSLGNYTGVVTVSSSPLPSGLPMSPTPTTVTLTPGGTNNFNLTFQPTTQTTPQTYTVDVTGIAGERTHLTTLVVTVTSMPVGGVILPMRDAVLLINILQRAGSIILVGIVALALVLSYKYPRKRPTGS